MKLDLDQQRWLKIHGDRRPEDVLQDDKGHPFVLMYDPEKGQVRVYLPVNGLYFTEEGGAK